MIQVGPTFEIEKMSFKTRQEQENDVVSTTVNSELSLYLLPLQSFSFQLKHTCLQLNERTELQNSYAYLRVLYL
jgi:hypothetical protein